MLEEVTLQFLNTVLDLCLNNVLAALYPSQPGIPLARAGMEHPELAQVQKHTEDLGTEGG